MKIAVIPARGGSKRISKKNIRDFHRKPVISYSIKAALACGIFDEVIVSTDDEMIADVAKAHGATVPFMRASEIADDFATIIDVMKDTAHWYKENGKKVSHLCLIYATAPMIAPDDILHGFDMIQNSKKSSVVSVAKFTYPIQRALEIKGSGALEMIQPAHLLTRSQDLPEAYMDAAHFIWTTPEVMGRCKISLLEQSMLPVVIPTHRVQDMDTLEDWGRAEALFSALN